MCRRTASRSVADTDWRTAFSAHSTLRPRVAAIVRANAAASFSTLLFISLSKEPPSAATGWAAPMLVAGAIAAMGAAIVMKTPAEAARAPVGATYTTTGTSELRISCTIDRMERSSPPGVSSWMTRATACSLRARSSALVTMRTVTGLITPSTVTSATGPPAAAEAGMASASRTTASRAPRINVRAPGARRIRRAGWRPGAT